MSMLDSVSGLIECAKRLRGVAEALDAGDVKAQIVEELLRLHEIRDGLLASGAAGAAGAASGSGVPLDPRAEGAAQRAEAAVGRVTAEPRKLLIDGDAKTFTFDADEVTETYSLHVDAPGAQAPAPAANAAPATATADSPGGSAPRGPNGDPAAARPSTGAGNDKPVNGAAGAAAPGAANAGTPASGSPGEMSEQQRLALAEQRILELEPMHQAALRKMNDLLTDEQRRIKAEATRAGTKAGKKGRELQHAVMAALKLTPDQQQRMAAARKELLDVRQAIARQVEGLLSKEQLERMLQQFAKKHGS